MPPVRSLVEQTRLGTSRPHTHRSAGRRQGRASPRPQHRGRARLAEQPAHRSRTSRPWQASALAEPCSAYFAANKPAADRGFRSPSSLCRTLLVQHRRWPRQHLSESDTAQPCDGVGKPCNRARLPARATPCNRPGNDRTLARADARDMTDQCPLKTRWALPVCRLHRCRVSREATAGITATPLCVGRRGRHSVFF